MPRYIVSRLGLAVVMAILATLVIILIANTRPDDSALAQPGDVAASHLAFLKVFRARDLPLSGPVLMKETCRATRYG